MKREFGKNQDKYVSVGHLLTDKPITKFTQQGLTKLNNC